MKITKSIISGLALSLLAVSCGEEVKPAAENKPAKEEVVEEIAPQVFYSVLEQTAEVKWKGFKLAEKVGVEGAFKEFTLTGFTQHSESVAALMLGTEITINVASTNTGDEVRDGKIVASFFGKMIETTQIKATIISLSGVENGIATIAITMNGMLVEKQLNWAYTKDNATFLITGNLNVPDWGAQTALDELNKVCAEKHKGEGNKAVTWPDVDVSAFITVTETKVTAN